MKWSRVRDLNPRHPPCKRGVTAAELTRDWSLRRDSNPARSRLMKPVVSLERSGVYRYCEVFANLPDLRVSGISSPSSLTPYAAGILERIRGTVGFVDQSTWLSKVGVEERGLAEDTSFRVTTTTRELMGGGGRLEKVLTSLVSVVTCFRRPSTSSSNLLVFATFRARYSRTASQVNTLVP